jgi:sorting nexin-5/6/32
MMDDDHDGNNDGPLDGDVHGDDQNMPRDVVKIEVKDCKKQGNDWIYDIEVTINDNEPVKITRSFKEIQWLHRTLSRNMDLNGHIIPPLPILPSNKSDLPSTGVLGNCEALFGNLTRRHTLRLELFLQALADDLFFYENHIVYNFLIQPQLNGRERSGSSSGAMWSQISDAYTNFSVRGIQEPDEKFESFLKYVVDIIPNMEEAYYCLSENIFSWQRLGNNYVLTKAALQDVGTVDMNHFNLSKIELNMAEGLFDVGVNECMLSLDAALSLGAVMSYQADYFSHCKEMLYRRLLILQELLSANAQLDKAKPEKKEGIMRIQNQAESKFKDITKIAEIEVDKFTRQYQKHLRSGLLSFSEAHIAHSKRTLESLRKIKDAILNDDDN